MSYFKKTHPFLQLLIFAGIAVGCFMIFGFIGTLVLAKITGLDLMELSDPDKWDYSNPVLLTFIRGMLVIQFIGLFIIPVFLFARLSDSRPGEWLGLTPAKPLYFILGIIVLIVALPFVDWSGTMNQQLIPETTSIGKWMKASEESAARQIEFLLKRQNIKDLLFNLLFVAVFAGVGEELFFRGVLQRLFIKIFRNAWAGILVTAFIFSAFHFQFYGFIPRFILGILLGLIYWYSGSLWPAIVAHFAYDAFAIIMIYFNPALAEKDSVSISLGNQSVLAAISVALVIAIIVAMKRKSTNSYAAVYARDNIDESNPFLDN
ncbi:MAG TPA: CPBP family intramembrane glutamic endopeptidase [Chitinophagaceae bacterium]|nr:CPBP family intramembrane glutamic endopeptidase [Chitinophagaceae bacterium]